MMKALNIQSVGQFIIIYEALTAFMFKYSSQNWLLEPHCHHDKMYPDK